MSDLVVAERLRKVYRGRSRAAVESASLVIGAGDSVGLVGESGSGKSTLARMLVGLEEPTSGTLLVDGAPWSRRTQRGPVRRKVQMVFQDPYRSLDPRISPRLAVAQVVRLWDRCTRKEADRRAGALLADVGLTGEVIDRRPAGLSGGQRQRVGIARALAPNPEFLIADEPTASLDVSVQAQILNLLTDLRRSRGLALLLVSHDLGVVRHMTESVLVMRSGEIVERGSTTTVFQAPEHPYTRQLIQSIPSVTP